MVVLTATAALLGRVDEQVAVGQGSGAEWSAADREASAGAVGISGEWLGIAACLSTSV